MKLIDSIKILQEQGVDIKYFHRKDGGYIVTKIGGVSYKGAAGNAVVRQLTGATLSKAKQAQLKSITTKGVRKKEDLPEGFKERVIVVQRKWKRAGLKGKITLTKYRKTLKEIGYEETMRALEDAERKTEGLASHGNIDTLIERLKLYKDISGNTGFDELIADFEAARDRFKDEWIPKIYDEMYNIEEEKVSLEQGIQNIKRIIGAD